VIPSDDYAMLISLLALFVGALFGFLVHRTAAAIKANGDWPKVPPEKRFYLGMAGVIAAMLAGLWVLMRASGVANEGVANEQVLWELWMWQTAAAWLGPLAIDEVWQRIKGGTE